jgi:hypothetical protein
MKMRYGYGLRWKECRFQSHLPRMSGVFPGRAVPRQKDFQSMTASLAIRERMNWIYLELFESTEHKRRRHLIDAISEQGPDLFKTLIEKRFAFGPWSRGVLSILGIISLFPVCAQKGDLPTLERSRLLRPRMQRTNPVPVGNRHRLAIG